MSPRKVASSGFALIPVIVAAGLSAWMVQLVISEIHTLSRRVDETRRIYQADLHATEILELFQAMGNQKLKAYLSKNPISGSTATAALYPLCAHINLLDRPTGVLLNEDPLAVLPPWAAPKANRFFKIEVIDTVTLNFRSDLCNIKPSNLYFPGETPPAGTPAAQILGPTEKFHVTVGVIWPTFRATSSEDLKRRVISGAIVQN